MKKLIFSVFALFLFAASPVFANSDNPHEPLIVRSQVAEGGLEIVLANLEQQTTTLSLTRLDRKKKVFTDFIRKHNGYSYKLALDKLKNGRYLLAVKKGDVIRQQVILISDQGMMCSDWK
ncbi:hypothetical protein [Neolewinella agarilytica]|uniref:Uncharacterized protein n=1 Tax=Neolewinella agarilytica TaxID=478744 RepID=A0A1H9ARC1_9BACT|nr:hypothetical protein [Neolewinella agarilytica]SEP79081.1 hypothetical protein SAMN05444359_102193 [Neolewinella agarilytica]